MRQPTDDQASCRSQIDIESHCESWGDFVGTSLAQVGREEGGWETFEDEPYTPPTKKVFHEEDRRAADVYTAMLGVNAAPKMSVYRYREHQGTGWQAANEWECEYRRYLVLQALTDGKTRVDLRGVHETRIITADIDVHGASPTPYVRAIGEGYIQWTKHRAHHESCWRAEMARETVEELQELVRATLVEKTGGGYHLVWKLSTAIPIVLAAQIARALVMRVKVQSKGVKVESFPQIDAGGGKTCALPLMGCAREVEGDLVTPVFSRRRASVAAFLADPGIDVDELLELLDLAVDRKGVPEASEPAAKAEEYRKSDTDIEIEIRPESGQLRKEDFAVECLRILKEGIPKGEHYDTCRRITACFFYVAENGDEARERYEKWIALPIHESWHAQHDPRHLMRDFECQLRHFERGVDAGRCRWNGMKSEKIRAVMDVLDFGRYSSASLAA